MSETGPIRNKDIRWDSLCVHSLSPSTAPYDLLFLIRLCLMLYKSHLPTTDTYICIFRNWEGKMNSTKKKFCYKICCELESLFVDGLSHLTQIEWLLREKMQPVNLSAVLLICSFLIDQRQNAGNSFWRVAKIIDGEDYLIQEAYQEMQVVTSSGGNDCHTCE